jgi:hypothetical protein
MAHAMHRTGHRSQLVKVFAVTSAREPPEFEVAAIAERTAIARAPNELDNLSRTGLRFTGDVERANT